jgi:hypothetical protein
MPGANRSLPASAGSWSRKAWNSTKESFPVAKVPQRHWHNQVYINQFLYAILAEEKCEQAGVEIAYYEFPQIHRLYVHGADSTNSRTVTKANLIGRKTILERVRKEGSRLMHLQPEIGFRESYRIEGETVITVNDYRDGRVFDDAVSYAFYPVDLHTRAGGVIPGKYPLQGINEFYLV